MIAYFLSGPLNSLFGIPTDGVHIGFDVFALIAACICLGIFSNTFKFPRTKTLYLVVCGIFTLVLSLVLIFNS